MSGETRRSQKDTGTVFDLSSLLSTGGESFDRLPPSLGEPEPVRAAAAAPEPEPPNPTLPAVTPPVKTPDRVATQPNSDREVVADASPPPLVPQPAAIPKLAQSAALALDDFGIVSQSDSSERRVDRLAEAVKSALETQFRLADDESNPKGKAARGFRKLARIVTSDDPPETAVLCETIVKLGRTGDVRAFGLILRHIKSRCVDVREAAVTALGLLGEARCVPALLRCVLDRRETVARQAINSLGACGDARAIRPMLAYGLAAAQNRAVLIEGIAAMDDSIVSELINVTLQPDSSMAGLAIVALGRFDTAAARQCVQRFLAHSQRQLCLNAITAFVNFADRKQCKVLHPCLADPRPEIRKAAAAGLARLPHPANVKPLLQLVANTNESPDVLTAAAEALGATEDPRALDGLYFLFHRSDPSIHLVIANALGRVGDGDDRAVQTLMKLTDSPEPRVKFHAVVALTRLQDSRAMPILLQALEADDSSIRRQAVVALGRIEGSDAVLQIGRRLESDPHSEVRAAAARALGRPGRESAIRLLESALRDDVSVRCQAVTALSVIGGTSVIGLLKQSVSDPAPKVRCQAIHGLARVKVFAAVESIARCLNDNDQMVVRAAEKALRELGADRRIMGVRLQTRFRRTRQTLLPDFLLGVITNKWTLTATLLMGLSVFGFRNLVGGSSAEPIRKRGTITRVAFGPHGELAVVTKGGWLEIRDVSTNAVVRHFKHAHATDAQFRTADRIVVSTATALHEYSLNARPEDVNPTVIADELDDPPQSLIATPSGCIALQKRTVLVATAGENNTFKVRRLPLGSLRAQLLAASPDGALLFTAGASGTANVVNVSTGEQLARGPIAGKSGRTIPTAMNVSADGERLVIGTTDGRLCIRELMRFDDPILTEMPGRQRVRAVAFLPDSKTIAIADDAPAVSIWSPDEAQPRRLDGFDGEQADTIWVSPDGRTIAIGSNDDDCVWILNVEDGSLVGKLTAED